MQFKQVEFDTRQFLTHPESNDLIPSAVICECEFVPALPYTDASSLRSTYPLRHSPKCDFSTQRGCKARKMGRYVDRP